MSSILRNRKKSNPSTTTATTTPDTTKHASIVSSSSIMSNNNTNNTNKNIISSSMTMDTDESMSAIQEEEEDEQFPMTPASLPSPDPIRHQSSGGNISITKLPWTNSSTGELATEVTHIPTADSTKELPKKTNPTLASSKTTKTTDGIPPHHLTPQSSSELEHVAPWTTTTATTTILSSSNPALSSAANTTTTTTTTTNSSGTRLAMSGAQVKKDERRYRKIAVRVISGAILIGIFVGCVYMGHLYVCMIVAFGEFLLFRELVKVRYHANFATIQDTIPLFRTTQWMWFVVAIFYTYGDFIVEIIQNNTELHYLLLYARYSTSIAFILYSGTFVLTIATMQVGLIKFQLNQLCWTIVVLCLTVGQMKYIMHNIFNGLIWFVLPFLLVVTNDIMAYVSGVTCGRKFIQREFIVFSPNKTWEGFIGGGISTVCASWYLSRYLASAPILKTWMTCPTNEFRLFPEPLECDPHPIFHQAQSIFPPQMFELFPPSLVKMIPGIVEICSVKDIVSSSSSSSEAAAAATAMTEVFLERCISGESSHIFHHFELVVKNVYPIQIHAAWLALFASLVAPFGGFLASAIKRAYGIKDFDSIIPGHGGVMDRMDCQFLMALCTWVHYNTFVKLATVSVPKLWYMYGMLSESEKLEFLSTIVREEITTTTTTTVAPSTVHAIRQAAEAAMTAAQDRVVR